MTDTGDAHRSSAGTSAPADAPNFTEYRAIVLQHLDGRNLNYYKRSQWNRRYFRASGVLVILASSALPLLASLDYSAKDVVLSVVGVSVAALTGLRSFFRWDEAWALLRKSDLALTEAQTRWDLELAAAAKDFDTAAGSARALAATEVFLARIRTLREQESDNYFEALAFPEPGTRQRV